MAVTMRGKDARDMHVRSTTGGMATERLMPFDYRGVGIFRHGQAHATLGAKRSWVASSSDHKFLWVTSGASKCLGRPSQRCSEVRETKSLSLEESTPIVLYPRTVYTDLNRLRLLATFDTDGEVIFAMASTLTHQDFQRSTKYELRVFPTSPSVSKAPMTQDVVARAAATLPFCHTLGRVSGGFCAPLGRQRGEIPP
jgi:hypothetical protein